MRYALTVEYDGTSYSGWQRQKNAVSVQQKVEEALEVVLGKKTVIVASGRTDAGVHAKGQVAHFDSDKTLVPRRTAYSLNALLPDDIKIVGVRAVSDDFHAQYSAKRKTYVYNTYVSDNPSPMRSRYYARILPPVDIEKMRRASKSLIGKHDFKAFCSTGSSIKSTVREIYAFDIIEQGDEVIFRITGNGFLYNMVRIIVGALISFGEGKISLLDLEKMVDGERRPNGIKTMPAKALCLKNVEYQ